jgi:hypothetical protein
MRGRRSTFRPFFLLPPEPARHTKCLIGDSVVSRLLRFVTQSNDGWSGGRHLPVTNMRSQISSGCPGASGYFRFFLLSISLVRSSRNAYKR